MDVRKLAKSLSHWLRRFLFWYWHTHRKLLIVLGCFWVIMAVGSVSLLQITSDIGASQLDNSTRLDSLWFGTTNFLIIAVPVLIIALVYSAFKLLAALMEQQEARAAYGSAQFGDTADAAHTHNTRPKNLLAQEQEELSSIAAMGVDSDYPVGFLLGWVEPTTGPKLVNAATKRNLLTYWNDSHLITFGGTRSGKGAGAVLPALLAHGGSCIVIDPKGELARFTRGHRCGQKQLILDPFNTTGFGKTDAINPLDFLGTDNPDAESQVSDLTQALIIPGSVKGGKDFVNRQAGHLLDAIILYVAQHPFEEGNRTLGRVRDIIMQDDDGFIATLRDMQRRENCRLVQDTARKALTSQNKAAKVAEYFQMDLRDATEWLNVDAMRDVVSHTTTGFDLGNFKFDYTTVYLCLPSNQMDRNAGWLRAVIGALLNSVMSTHKKPQQPVLFMLDEAAQLGNLPLLEKAMGISAGFGMQIWSIWQDMGQLRKHYGDAADTFLANSEVKQFMRVSDQTTAKYVSDMMGRTTVEVPVTRTDGEEPRQINYMSRNLMDPHEITQLDTTQGLVFMDGKAPYLIKKLNAYTDPGLKKHLDFDWQEQDG